MGPTGPQQIRPIVPKRPPLSEAELAERRRRQEAIESDSRDRHIKMRLADLRRDRGIRYAAATLENFICDNELQAAAVRKLSQFREDMAEHIAEGHPLVIFGPAGTGKDHLLFAMMEAAIRLDKRVRWANGVDLYGEIRDLIDDRGGSESAFVSEYAGPDVLAISDPLPPGGPLTEFQSSFLFRILDRRYSNQRPTWVTVNVKGGDELDERLGIQLADRLRDGAIAIKCDWGSFRRSIRPT